MNIIEAIRDHTLINDEISPAQEVFLRSLYGLSLDAEQREIYTAATGISEYRPREFRASTAICGRRSGKSSKLAANIATFESAFRQHALAPGERGYVIVIASTQRQAAVCYSYILARFERSPVLRDMIAGDPRQSEFDLVNGLTVTVWPCNFRSIRGLSIVCCICDELAFWFDDISNANPASAVLAAIRPGQANFPTAKLIGLTSPHAKTGLVWESYRDRAQHPDQLIWRASTRVMNPSLDENFLRAEEARDPESFAREYGAEFYESASAFLPAEAVDACIQPDRYELPPDGASFYVASLDAAFRGDAFSYSIVHRAGDRIVEDLTRSRVGRRARPVVLSDMLEEIVGALRRYGIAKIYGDSFCSEPIRQSLRRQGVEFVQAHTLGTRSAPVWNSMRTLITSGKIELLDASETIAELKRLELILAANGNQRVEASAGHDDRAVSLSLAAHQCVAMSARTPWIENLTFPDAPLAPDDPGPSRWWTPM